MSIYSNLTVNVGGMFSGKTTELLRQGKRHMLAKDDVIYIKPNIDDRYSDTKVVSHDGEASDYNTTLVIDPKDTILCDEVKKADVILIDEVQFFDKGIILDILILLEHGKKIYCSGLDLSYNNKVFEVTAHLMGFADVVNKFKAVCSECGRDAWITAKKGSHKVTDDIVDVGSGEKYIPLCRECYRDKNIGGIV